jgi:hypothetical protein
MSEEAVDWDGEAVLIRRAGLRFHMVFRDSLVT